jgi:hypothetical protein
MDTSSYQKLAEYFQNSKQQQQSQSKAMASLNKAFLGMQQAYKKQIDTRKKATIQIARAEKEQEKAAAKRFQVIATQLKNLNTTTKSMVTGLATLTKQIKVGQVAARLRDAGANAAKNIKKGAKGVWDSGVVQKTAAALFNKNVLGNLLKGLGLYAMFKAPEMIGDAVEMLREKFEKIGAVVGSESFQKGMQNFGKAVIAIGGFAIDRFVQVLDGFAGTINNFERIGNAFTRLKEKDVAGAIESLGEIDWGDFGNLALGLGSLAVVLKPFSTVGVGYKALKWLGATGLPKLASALGFGKGAATTAAAGTAGTAGTSLAAPFTAGAVASFLGAYFAELQVEQARNSGLTGSSRPGDGTKPSAAQLTNEQLLRSGFGGAFKMGGSIVPGSGSGDRVHALLEPGEYIMNREAVRGIGKANLDALNFNYLPRFQTGGIVAASHTDTGAGHAVKGVKDAHGRPLVLSESAAASFARILEESNGKVKGSHVASAQRSRSKNDSLAGAHPNSHHLYGEAIDVSGDGYTWMMEHGHKYGWKFGYNHGKGSGHFSYVGPGAGKAPAASGQETYVAGDLSKSQSSAAKLTGLSGLGTSIGMGVYGGAFGAAMDALNSVFGGAANAKTMPSVSSSSSSSTNTAVSSLFNWNNKGKGLSSFASRSPLKGTNKAKSQQIYNYLMSKPGMTHNKAMGILANINAESGFRTGVMGDNGTSGGLFQMHAGRFDAMVGAVPDWKTNWQGQIDFALGNDVAPQYMGMTFGSGGDAADWFMNNFERPAYGVRPQRSIDQRNFIDNFSAMKMSHAPNKHAQSYAMASHSARAMGLMDGSSPQVVVVPAGGGGTSGGATGGAVGGSNAPTISGFPTTAVAADYLARISMGALLS